MAKRIITDAGLWVGPENLRCLANSVVIEGDSEIIDVSTFCSGEFSERIVGDRTITIGAAGFIDTTDTSDSLLEGVWGLTDGVLTASVAIAAGAHAFVGRFIGGSLSREWARGAVATFDLSGMLAAAAVGYGRLLRYAPGEGASGNGAAVLWKAIPADATAQAALHVLSLSAGASIDVTVQSDDNAGFTTPTTRAAFGAKSATGGFMLPMVGPVADTYYRAIFTITGGSPSVGFAVSVGGP